MSLKHGWLQFFRELSARALNSGANRRRGRSRSTGIDLERLESRQLLATFSVRSTKVASGVDYFATEQNNALDYNEAQSNIGGVDDRQNAGLDDDNLTNPTVSGGSYNFTTTASSQVYLLHPGFVDGENNPVNRQIGVVPEDTTGETIPIDTSAYYILNMKITAPSNIPNVELVGGAAYQGNIQWDNGRAVSPTSATRSFFLYPGTNIYSFNLKTITLANSGSGAWTGNISGLRLYPSNTAGVNISIDWVTLTGENQASVPVSIGGQAGQAQIGLSTDGNAANLIKLNKPTGNTDGEFATRRHLVGPTTASGITSVDVSMLGPGTYFLHTLDASGNVLSGTSAQQITINAAPSSKIQSPSFYGDLSRDYATTIRGDAWDFSQTSDFKIPFVTNPTEYGSATLVTDPVTSLVGQVSANANSWMRYDNFSASVAANRGDPQYLLSQTGIINPSVYKNLTVRQLLDRTRDVGLGAVTRFGWSDTDPLAGGFASTIVQTDDIIAENGVRDLHVYLPEVKLEPRAPSTKKWSDSKAIQYLRIDPHEYTTQTVTYTDQVWLTPNERTTNGKFNITWTTADGNSDGISVTRILLDTDRSRANGGFTVVANSPVNSGLYQLDTATLSSLAAGSYYVLLEVSDGQNTSYRYSSGRIDVTPVGPAGTKIMQRVFNPNANFHFFSTSEAQVDNALRVGYQDEATARTGFAIYTSQVAGSTPLHRLYNLEKGFHYYTINTAEKDNLVALTPPGSTTIGWRYEGDEGFMFATQQPGTSEIYRLYNRDSGTHLFTQDVNSKNTILTLFPNSWRQESSVGFAFATGYGSAAAAAPPGSASALSTSELDSLLAELRAAGVEPRVLTALGVVLSSPELTAINFPGGLDTSLIASLIANPEQAAELLSTLQLPPLSEDGQQIVNAIDELGVLDDVLEQLNLGDSRLGDLLNRYLGS